MNMTMYHLELCGRYGVDPTSTQAYILLVERMNDHIFRLKQQVDMFTVNSKPGQDRSEDD